MSQKPSVPQYAQTVPWVLTSDTLYTWALFDGPFMAFDLALYALMGFGPAALIRPVWRGLDVTDAH